MSKKISNAYLRILNHCKGSGLSPRAALIIMNLAENPDQRVGKLAVQTDQTQQATGKHITKLASAGFLVQEGSEKDRRARSINITTKGRKLVKRLETSW